MDVLYEDERIIVVDKPHFLATMPRRHVVSATALIRLRERLGEPDITPAHRLAPHDRGVLVFVRDSACRGAYQMLFQNRQAVKIYECLAPCRRSAAAIRHDHAGRTATPVPIAAPIAHHQGTRHDGRIRGTGFGQRRNPHRARRPLFPSRWREVARSAGGWSPSGKSPHLPLHTPPAHRQNPPIARPHEFAPPAPSWATTSTRASRHAPTTISASRCN